MTILNRGFLQDSNGLYDKIGKRNIASIDDAVGLTIPDKRVKNDPQDKIDQHNEDLKKVINTEIYNNMRFYIKIFYENAVTETDVILLKALWRGIKRMMKINRIEIEKERK